MEGQETTGAAPKTPEQQTPELKIEPIIVDNLLREYGERIEKVSEYAKTPEERTVLLNDALMKGNPPGKAEMVNERFPMTPDYSRGWHVGRLQAIGDILSSVGRRRAT